MKRRQLVVLLFVLMGLVVACAAYGQGIPTKPLTMNFNGIGVKTAIQELFSGAPDLSLVIDSSVTDNKTVTTDLIDASFQDALDKLMELGGLSYSVSGNVYTISVKKSDAPEATPIPDINVTPGTPVKAKEIIVVIPIGNADVNDMVSILEGRSPRAGGRFGGGGFGGNGSSGGFGSNSGGILGGGNNNNSGYGNNNNSGGFGSSGGLFGNSSNNSNNNSGYSNNNNNNNNSSFRL